MKRIFFSFLQIFSDKVKTIFWESQQIVQKYLNQNVIIGSFQEHGGFEATLMSKANDPSVWKGHFSIYCIFLSDEVETVFSRIEARYSKEVESKFDDRKLLRNRF